MLDAPTSHRDKLGSRLKVGLLFVLGFAACVYFTGYVKRELRWRQSVRDDIVRSEFVHLRSLLMEFEAANEPPPETLATALASKYVTPYLLASEFKHLSKGVDFWGHPFRYVVTEIEIGVAIRLQSDGPNGKDDHGTDDDIRMTCQFTIDEKFVKAWNKAEFEALKGVLAQYENAHEIPPDTLSALLDSKYKYVRPSGGEYEFSRLRSGVDSWGSPFRYSVTKTAKGAEVRLQCDGPNGVDDHGAGDDFVVTSEIHLDESQRLPRSEQHDTNSNDQNGAD